MTISPEIEAKILRYYYVEKWRVGTISRELSVHHTTVKRVLAHSGVPKGTVLPRPSIIDPYLGFILETLEKHPALTARRLYDMVCERGYPGSADHFRHLIAMHRPRRAAEAYLRLRTLPGEQAQVDWAHFNTIKIGKAERPVMAFVMVLSYSRKIFLRFYLNQRMANFLRGHEAAFETWGGVPKVLLYDNLKSAVLERRADAIRFHPTLLDFSAHYRYEPRPVAVARGNEKGRVERAIRYVRDNFFAARKWDDLDDLNQQAVRWCDGVASARPCPEDKSQSVRTMFEAELPSLIPLPGNPYPTDEEEAVTVGKTPYVRFDLNDYSVPFTHVRRTLLVRATPGKVNILDGMNKLAEHVRSYDKGQQIENPEHIRELRDWKKQAKQHSGQDRLTYAAPSASTFLKNAAQRNYSLASITANLLLLLDDYGAEALEAAIVESLKCDAPHVNAVQMSLEVEREKQNKYPPVHLSLPDDPRVRHQVIRPHKLNSYDNIQYSPEKNNNDDNNK
jgi:transposase